MVPAPNSRLTELLDQLRQEFENQSRSTGEFEHQRMFCYFLGPLCYLDWLCDENFACHGAFPSGFTLWRRSAAYGLTPEF